MKTGIIAYHRRVAEAVWKQINQDTFPKTRCSTNIVKLILLLHDTDCNMLNGERVVFKKKNLGAGVYEVWMQKGE